MYQLYEVVPQYIDNKTRSLKKRKGGWDYGYHEDVDLIVISKDRTLGEVYYMNGIYIGLPEVPDKIESVNDRWVAEPYPEALSKIKTSFDWEKKDQAFRDHWQPFIDQAFDRREYGHWFMNNKKPTYITGSHYMYLQWSKIDVGLPEYREANRLLYIYWEACKADRRCLGMNYVKIRRSGFSYMFASECVNIATITAQARIGILSKTGTDASKMFTGKVVPIFKKYPFFFKPIQDGSDAPKTELAFRVPATKITKKSMVKASDENEVEGLDTTIDWKNTDDNSYDGEKLQLLIEDEAGKWLKPNSIKANWDVVQTCLKTGSDVVGKCAMGSTVNALAKGGQGFKDIFYDSDPRQRDDNGQTVSGLYGFFIPMEWNFEGHIDKYGFPVLHDPTEPVFDSKDRLIKQGAITYWENKVKSKKHDSDGLNEHYRQYPRTLNHAFRDEAKSSIFNLTKIYAQVDYNESLVKDGVVVQGSLSWRDGIRFSQVVWSPNKNGRFLSSWIPPKHLQNRVSKRGDKYYPENEHLGAFGCDSYDISGTVDGSGSKGALHGKTGFSMEENVPANFFFLEYCSRPPTAEIFFEDVLMACWFYGMPMLAENNKARLLYHFKNAGCRAFSLNRPDKKKENLSVTERELGGIPSNSADIIQAHAAGIETYIEKSVGYDVGGDYRDPDEMGNMFFNSTLIDWAGFDITNRTKYDRSISSGLAIMATNRHLFIHKPEKQPVTIRIAKFDNSGSHSKRIL